MLSRCLRQLVMGDLRTEGGRFWFRPLVLNFRVVIIWAGSNLNLRFIYKLVVVWGVLNWMLKLKLNSFFLNFRSGDFYLIYFILCFKYYL